MNQTFHIYNRFQNAYSRGYKIKCECVQLKQTLENIFRRCSHIEKFEIIFDFISSHRRREISDLHIIENTLGDVRVNELHVRCYGRFSMADALVLYF